MRVFKNIWKSAVLLGLFALGSETLLSSFQSSNYFHLGLLFIFLSACSLGLRATLVASSFFLLPLALFQNNWSWAIQTYIVVLITAWVCEKWNRVPAFIPVTTVWFVFIAAHSVAVVFGLQNTIDHMALLAGLTSSSCLSLIAGTILLAPEVSSLLHRRPKRYSYSFIAMHLVTLAACFLFGLAIMLLGTTISFPMERIAAEIDPLVLLIVTLVLFGVMPLATVKLIPVLRGKEKKVESRTTWSEVQDIQALEQTAEPSESQHAHNNGRGSWIFNDQNLETGEHPNRAVLVLDSRARVSFANSHFLEVLGIENSKILGKEVSELKISSDLKKALLSAQEHTLEFGPGVSEFLCQEAGKQRFFEIASVLPPRISRSEGQPSVIFTITEITERRTLEEHLLQSQRAKSLSSIVANAAHALNNKLTTIIGTASIQLQQDEKLTADSSRDALSIILDNANSAGKLIWKILDLVEDKGDLKKEIDLRGELSELQGALQSFVGTDFPVELKNADKALWVTCDPSMLMQAMTNLVINSKEAYHSERTGRIEISLDSESIDREVAHLHPGSSPGEFARIRIQDWGCGMSSEIMRKAFEPLFSTKNERGQSGLGLSTVYAIVRSHRGFLSIESQPGKGTSISLYFPLLEQVTQKSPEKEKVTLSTSVNEEPRKRHILIVEDEPSVRTLISKMVSTLGYEVTSCEDGKRALEDCRSKTFDLVLVDMMMPQMSGEEFVKMLSQQSPDVPTVIMTGLVSSVDETTSSSALLAKPFDLTTLSSIIEKQLASPKNNSQNIQH